MKLRSTAVTAAVSAAAALTASGITYASAAPATAPQAAPAVAAPALQAAPAAAAPAPQAAPAAAAPLGGSGGGNNNSKGNEGNGNKGNDGNGGDKGDYRGGGGQDDEGYGDNEGQGQGEGRIQINERSYSARRGECVTVLSDLGARSLNIRNDTRKTVEVFRGAACDNGSPIATVGPHSSSYGVHPGHVDGIDIDKGVVASFRVIKRHHEDD